ncbi:hypothetical protein GA0115259_1124414 [Streptomyces sp. MnatMP-M17]|nr:hypothetical protein GA0115259_1124414 [Streptomyces sp. MnatMP-M17]
MTYPTNGPDGYSRITSTADLAALPGIPESVIHDAR